MKDTEKALESIAEVLLNDDLTDSPDSKIRIIKAIIDRLEEENV